MNSAFPEGPIGFKVYGIGWREGLPYVHALVAINSEGTPFHEPCSFLKGNQGWVLMGMTEGLEKVLNEEEQAMLQSIWEGECKKLGLPFDNGKDQG